MMMTPDLETVLQPIEEENEQGIPIEKEVMVTETTSSEGHAQELPVHASKKKEAITDNAEHCQEQENVDARGDHIGWSCVPEKKKRKQVNDTNVQDIVSKNPSAAHLKKPERVIVIPREESIRTSTMSELRDSIRSCRITKRR